jgi:hypothetical protein
VAGKEVTLVIAEVHYVHDPLAHTHHLLQLCPYSIHMMWSIVEPTCWARWYIS